MALKVSFVFIWKEVVKNALLLISDCLYCLMDCMGWNLKDFRKDFTGKIKNGNGSSNAVILGFEDKNIEKTLLTVT